jgi:hypothetical protein
MLGTGCESVPISNLAGFADKTQWSLHSLIEGETIRDKPESKAIKARDTFVPILECGLEVWISSRIATPAAILRIAALPAYPLGCG